MPDYLSWAVLASGTIELSQDADEQLKLEKAWLQSCIRSFVYSEVVRGGPQKPKTLLPFCPLPKRRPVSRNFAVIAPLL